MCSHAESWTHTAKDPPRPRVGLLGLGKNDPKLKGLMCADCAAGVTIVADSSYILYPKGNPHEAVKELLKKKFTDSRDWQDREKLPSNGVGNYRSKIGNDWMKAHVRDGLEGQPTKAIVFKEKPNNWLLSEESGLSPLPGARSNETWALKYDGKNGRLELLRIRPVPRSSPRRQQQKLDGRSSGLDGSRSSPRFQQALPFASKRHLTKWPPKKPKQN